MSPPTRPDNSTSPSTSPTAQDRAATYNDIALRMTDLKKPSTANMLSPQMCYHHEVLRTLAPEAARGKMLQNQASSATLDEHTHFGSSTVANKTRRERGRSIDQKESLVSMLASDMLVPTLTKSDDVLPFPEPRSVKFHTPGSEQPSGSTLSVRLAVDEKSSSSQRVRSTSARTKSTTDPSAPFGDGIVDRGVERYGPQGLAAQMALKVRRETSHHWKCFMVC